MFFEILQNSLENTSARVSFLIKLQTSPCKFINKETLAQVFSCEFCEISKNTFFTEHLWVTAFSVNWGIIEAIAIDIILTTNLFFCCLRQDSIHSRLLVYSIMFLFYVRRFIFSLFCYVMSFTEAATGGVL